MSDNKSKNKEVKINGYEIVRLDIRDMQEGATFEVTKNNLNCNKIKIRSSEIVRIIAAFNPDSLKTDGSKYSYIKDLILLKIGKSYNKYYEQLCKKQDEGEKGVFTLNIINIDEKRHEKIEEKIRYKRLLCGSSFVRNSKELYVREELYDKVMEVLLTGMSPNTSFPCDKVAKYSTYLGLAATDSKPVSMPNICVVKDYNKMIKDAFDIIKQTKIANNQFKYEVINYDETLEESEEMINCFDGAGIVSYERAKIWAEELGLNYVPSSFQIRVLNGIKGNLYTFPVSEFIKCIEEKGLEKHLDVCDLWNEFVNIKKQKIDVFLTESQFKFNGKYKNFKEWKTAFDEPVIYNNNEYKRTFNISEVSRDITQLNEEVWSAYQPLQTLEFYDEELQKLAEPTVSMAKKLYTDIDEFIKYRGLSVISNEEESGEWIQSFDMNEDDALTPWYYKALTLDDSLQYDPYIKQKIEDDLKSIQRRIFMGKLILKGNYQTAMPDLLALMEHICGLPVVGALGKGEIYSNYWNEKQVNKVSIWRNPHIACEWFNAKVITNEKTERWFKYQTTGIVTDIYSTLALRLGTMDFDGDTIATVNSDIIYNAIERKNVHTIKVVTEDEKTSSNSTYNQQQFYINDFDKIMYTNKLGFQNNIGDVTNKVTVLWGVYGDTNNENEKKTINNYIKIMSVVNQLIIDFVKTGIKVPIPKDIRDVVSKSKKPAFMQNKKMAWVNDNKVETNAKTYDYCLNKLAIENDTTIDELVESQKKYRITNGTVDKLYVHLKEQMANLEMNFESITEECQFTKLLKNVPYIYNVTYSKVKNKIDDLLKMHNVICGKKYYDEKTQKKSDESTWRFERFYSYCEEELLNVCKDREKLLNYVIYLFYADKDFCKKDKGILWNVFGKDICNRYIGKQLCISDEIMHDLSKKEKKAKCKADSIKEMCKNASIVSIRNLPEKEIVITDAELKFIFEKLPNNKEAQRVLITLLAIYRKVNLDNTGKKPIPVKIAKGSKNEVTKNQICKLSDIYYNQIDNRIKLLYNEGLINIDVSNIKVPKITVLVPDLEKCHKEYSVGEINDVRTKIIDVCTHNLEFLF